MRAEDRERIVVEVTERIVERAVAATKTDADLEEVLASTLYHERQRLGRDGVTTHDKPMARLLKTIRSELQGASPQRKRELVREVVATYAREVLGRFNPLVYAFSTRVLTRAVGLLLGASSPLSLAESLPELPDVRHHLSISGAIERVRALNERGTLIFAPTHVSNLDSPVIGLAVHEMGLPPLAYGAGLNLFTNPLVSFFMHNLGAYKVDRRKQDQLYKDVLKEYATASMEYGYNNLFFPGGTRCRSGVVESRLKLGLLGCGLRAFINNLRAGRERPNVYIVPINLGFSLVLEGATLIEDHLKDAGKARYIITDDEFANPRTVASFVYRLVAMDAPVELRVGEPLDPFGNPVDDEGRSLDGRGRPLDPARYVYVDGEPKADAARDREYTSQLGVALGAGLRGNNVVASTNLLAFVLFRLLRRRRPQLDLLRLLRATEGETSFDLREVIAGTGRLLEALRERSATGGPHLSQALRASGAADDAEALVRRGLALFGAYHRPPVAERRGDRVFPTNPELVYYYHNRLSGYGLGAALDGGMP